jgi:hypothetical protein
MPDPLFHDAERDLQLKRAAWKRVATAQGLVCLVCRDAPALEQRARFYDTGLCAACAEDLAADAEQAPGL